MTVNFYGSIPVAYLIISIPCSEIAPSWECVPCSHNDGVTMCHPNSDCCHDIRQQYLILADKASIFH